MLKPSQSIFCHLVHYRRHTNTIPLTYSFLILSFLVTPLAHLSILISAILILCSVLLSTAQHSEPYSIACLTAFLYNLSLRPHWNFHI
jgi:hypothetical protein